MRRLAEQELAIKTAGLTKVFRDFWGHKKVVAVDNLDLEVRSHEVFGLLGPNGSGKSTTIKMLLGLLFPTRGWARVLGQLPGDVKTNARIGYLPEESYLYPFLNARETLDFYGRLFGLGYRQRKGRIDSLLDMVGLAGVSRRPVGEFSKGMIRRIGLAQALINDPDLLILDEPTAGLDPLGTRQIKDLISQLGKRGKAVLLCSHLLADVEDVCGRISILYGGKVQVEGEVNKLLAHSDMTQITTGRLSAECLGRVETLIHSEYGDYEVAVETPRDRLEDYFLRTVAAAQNAQVDTSGAVMGSGVSDFLSVSEGFDEGEVLIEKLAGGTVGGGATGGITDGFDKEPESKPVMVSGGDEVIDSLVGGTTVPVSGGRSDESQKKENLTTPADVLEEVAGDSEDVDQSVIDDLLSKKREDNESR